MKKRTTALSFRQSTYREDDQLRGGMTIVGRINKGKRQSEAKLHQSDLGDYLRVDPDPLDREVWGVGGTLVNALDLIHDTLGKKPGSRKNPLIVKVYTFDELLRNPLFVDACKRPSVDGMEYILQQVSRWAVCRAGTKNKIGQFGSIAIADPFAKYIVREKTPNGWVSYEKEEKLLEDTIVLNTPELGKALFNPGLSEDQECHLYKREDGKEVLVPWTFNGFLEVTIKRMQEAGMVGAFLTTINGKTNIVELTRTFLKYLKECAVYGIPFSMLEFRMYREKRILSVPGYGKGSIRDRRNNRQTKEHWNAILEPTAETMQLIERAKKAQFERRLAISSKSIEENNFDLFGFSEEEELPQEEVEISDDELFDSLLGDALDEPEFLSTGEMVDDNDTPDEPFFDDNMPPEPPPPDDFDMAPDEFDIVALFPWLTDGFLVDVENARTSKLFGKAIMEATEQNRDVVKKAWDTVNKSVLPKAKNTKIKIALRVALVATQGNEDMVQDAYIKACRMLRVDEL